jgi:putative nucleotidyltransferase with HDIG domain
MKTKYKKIWELALPYQDARDDKGHAEIVTHFAAKLCKIEKADENIVIPAAILHDIGWSQLSKKDRFLIFDKKIDQKERLRVRHKHQKEGVKLAKKILNQIDYNPQLVDEILEIISQHDTRDGFLSKNEATMRDADKLSRFSKVGFWDDIRLSKISQEHYHDTLKEKINHPNFLYSYSSRHIAIDELKKRKSEFQ